MKDSKKTIVIGLASWAVTLLYSQAAVCGKIYIPQGTEITVKFKTDITTESESEPPGTDIFEAASNLKISGVEVIRQGDKVFCRIIEFKKPGLLGGGGAIEVKVDSVQTSLGQNIDVETRSLTAKGKSKRLKAILMLPVLGYGILIKGDNAKLGGQNDTVILKTSQLERITF